MYTCEMGFCVFYRGIVKMSEDNNIQNGQPNEEQVASVNRANLEGRNLDNADMESAFLVKSDMRGASLIDADLEYEYRRLS